MASIALIPGAGGDAFYWHRVEPELRRMGHEVVAVELPTGDDDAGLAEYVDAVVTSLDGVRDRLVLVAQSMGGFTAPLVSDRLPVDLIVLVTAMVPVPGETAGQWWENTGQPAAMREAAERDGRSDPAQPSSGDFDLDEYFFHDVPDEVKAAVFSRGEPKQADRPFGDPWPRSAWPDVPTKFVLCRDDRMFPATWMRDVVRERLGTEPDEIAGGHLVALSNPVGLAELLHSYIADAGSPG